MTINHLNLKYICPYCHSKLAVYVNYTVLNAEFNNIVIVNATKDLWSLLILAAI